MKKGILIFILAVSVSVFGKENLNNVKIVSSSNVVTSNFSTTSSNFEKDRKDIMDLYEKFLNTYSNLEESSSFNIENDKATLTVKKASTSKKEKVNDIEGKELKLEFKKVSNKWLIDKAEETIF